MWIRRVQQALAVIACGIALAACESTPNVVVDYNPQYGFTGKTRVAVVRPAPGAVNDLTATRVGNALESALRARGYEIVPPEQAALWVSFFVTAQDKADVNTYNSYNTGFRYGRCWDPMRCAAWASPEIDVRYYKEGTLMIDMIDPSTKTLQWRGTTSKRLPSKPSLAERDAIAREVVDSILTRYPPTE